MRTANAQDTTQNFPATAEEFFADKPTNVSNYSWLYHPHNPFRFMPWVAKLINKINQYASLEGWTRFFQRTVASWFGISERWLRELIRRLILIGVLEDRFVWKMRQYRVNGSFFNGATNANDANADESSGDNRDLKHHINNHVDHENHHAHARDIAIDDAKPPDDPVVKEIAQEFKQVTGKDLQSKRDAKALEKLKTFATDVIRTAFNNVADFIAQTGSQINGLGYIATTAANIAREANKPAQPSKQTLSTTFAGNAQPSIRIAQDSMPAPTTYDPSCDRCYQGQVIIELEPGVFKSLWCNCARE